MKPLLPLLFLFILLTPTKAQIEWNRQYPLEKLEDVLDIDISDDGYGFASGTDDLLLRLDPSTKLWDLLPGFGEGFNYESIDYLDGSAGNIALAGGQGLILTTDGGQTWTKILLSPTDIRSVKMISATSFIVIAKDGAYTWNNSTWNDLADPATATIEGGFILDANNMWLWTTSTSAIIYSTSNGGQSWNNSNDISDVDVLKFFDPLNGIATDSREVYSSSNGGINWTLVSTNAIHNSSNDITFGSAANVVMAATFNADPTISFDGGVTWDRFGTGLLNQRSFSIEAITDSIFYVGNDLSGMALTEDQGDNWVETSGPERSIVQDIVFVNRSNGFAVGQSGMLLRTINGGNQWEDLSFGARSHYSIHGVNADDLWIGTSQRILHSTDMGMTWDDSGVFPTGNINKVFAISSDRVLAGSSSGEIYRTNNGGVTWDTMYNAGSPIRDFARIDNNTYMATGFNGVILWSGDQGEGWEPLTPPEPGLQYEDVFFLNGEGWLVTSSFKKTMWHTSDEGNSWDAITLPIDRFWDGVYFMSKDTGVIVGRSNTEGRAYVTYTGGQTWNPGYVLPFPLFGVAGIPHPNGTAWIYGYGSDIEQLSFCNAFPQISNFTGDLTPCQEDTILYTIDSENVDEYFWDFPSTTYIILGNPNNDSIYFIPGLNPGSLSVIGQNECGFTEQINVFIDLIKLPLVFSLIGDELPCAGDTELYWADARFTDNYNWLLPADWQIIGDPNTDSIMVLVGDEPGVITYSGTNVCTTTDTEEIEVKPFISPDVSVVINGDALSLDATANMYKWYQDGVLVPGATSPSFLATEDGMYYAELIYLPEQCTTYSNTVNIIVTSLQTDPQLKFDVFPVPSSEELNIRGITGDFQYRITDVFGKVISQSTSATGSIQIEHLLNGIYILNIDQDGSQKMARFIKQ